MTPGPPSQKQLLSDWNIAVLGGVFDWPLDRMINWALFARVFSRQMQLVHTRATPPRPPTVTHLPASSSPHLALIFRL